MTRRTLSSPGILLSVLTSAFLIATILTSGILANPDGSRDASAEPIWIYDSDLYVKHVETADLNGDNTPDVIAGEHDGDSYDEPSRVLAIDGLLGDTIWSYLVQDGIRSMTVGDLNDDGVVDAVAGASYNTSGTADGRVHAVDGKNGAQLWDFYIGATIEDVAVGDLNGDGNLDVVAASFDDYIYAIDGTSGDQLWKRLIGAMWVNDVETGDVNGDGSDDVAFAHEYLSGFDNFYGVLDGNSGTPIWADTVPSQIMSTLLVDIDNDMQLEAIFGYITTGAHGVIDVRNALDGSLEWTYDIGSVDQYNGDVLIYAYDIDDDTDLDLVCGTYLGNHYLYAFEGDIATPMWESEMLDGNPKDIAFGDVTGDGNLNIAVTESDRVEVLKANGGSKLWYYSVGGTMSSVAIADCDDDGIDDVVACGGADFVGDDPGKSVWALRTILSPLMWEFSFGSYGNEVAVGDLNNDGCDDAVGVNSDHQAYAIDGEKGTELWNWTATDNLFAVTIGDFDGDGFGDAAVGGYDAIVTALDGESGEIMWQFTSATDDFYRKCIKSADINKDGNVDVIAGSEDNNVYAINGEGGGEIWRCDCGADINDLFLQDMNGDDTIDVVAAIGGGTLGEKVIVIDGRDGTEMWSYVCPESVEHVTVARRQVAKDIYYDPIAALTPWSRQAIRINGETHLEMWATPMEVASSTHGISAGDVNSDGVDDIAVPGDSVHMLDGATGAEIWAYPTGGEVNCVLVYDVNLDGDMDVVAGSDDQLVYVLDGKTGDLIWSFSTADDVIDLAVGDINSNGLPNIVCITFGSDCVIYGFRSLATGPQYICGDADASGAVDIDDVVYLIAYIFSGGPAPDPLEAGDADCSDSVDIDDVVYLIAYIFSGGPEPCANCK